ncbi:MAG: ROK family protein [Bernardetiaceae bacterium]|jgi:predicted NBD/HSP70 family sugar kinase|nr:ROK family protein [Bernardetiaceae bacterium]
MANRYLWGFDLGGTKIEGVVLQATTQQVLVRQRIPTEAHLGYEHIVRQIVKLRDLLAQQVGHSPDQLGIGTPGTVDPGTGLMKNSNSTALNGQPLVADLQTALGIPVRLANDANCFALAEATMGVVPEQVPDYECVFGVILGTGVGGGVVVRGHDGQPVVLGGQHGIGGEWGHNFLDESGGPCYCGRAGCVETILSGTGLQKYYQQQSGRFAKLPDIVAWAAHGQDPVAVATLERLVNMFGRAIAPIINVLDPNAVVLGGGVGNIDLLYSQGVAQVLKYLFNPRLETKFLRPKLGDSAGVFGAAMLVA